MKSFTSSLFAIAAALSLVSAAPAINARTESDYVPITLFGAAGASYTTYAYFDEYTPTYNDLSISSVSYDHDVAECHFIGVDQKTAPPVESNGGQLGPPQTIVKIFCESY